MGQQNSLAVIDENSEVVQAKQVPLSSDLSKVQQRAIEEYPFLKSVYESIVVTDPALPDNPIIYCNDVFQRMTLYPREEIIGRNCRFLGGKFTSLTTRRKITEAIQEGKEMDVQLLNYRKDGTPFWNNFLLLPLHKKKFSKKITHFIGIQKDVTYLKQGRKDPSKWGPKEVTLFVTYFISTQPTVPLGGVNIADVIICNAINGARFLAASKDDWIKWGVDNKAQRKVLKEAASNLTLHKEDAIKILLNKGKEEEEDNLETAFFRSSPSPFKMFGKPSRSIDPISPRQLSYWNQKPSLGVTCVKFFKDGEVQIGNFATDVTYDQIQRRVNEIFPETKKSDFQLKAKCLGGDALLSSDEDFQDIKLDYEGRTLSLLIVGKEPDSSKEKEDCAVAH